MRYLIFAAPLVTAACFVQVPTETPERAVRSFNGSTVTIQSKTATVTAEDTRLARSMCPGARYTSTLFRVEGVSEYLFTC